MGAAIGIDIGGTNLRAARIDGDGTVLARAKAPSGRDPEAVFAAIAGLIEAVDGESAAAIGIGVPGRVDGAGRRVLSGGYVDLSGLALADRLEARFSRPVALDNDASMALRAEAAFGAARGLADAALLTIGTGIGGAVLAGGRILRGRGSAGQLGHLVVAGPGGEACLCGRRGCVETASSGTALARHIAGAGLPAATTADALLAAAEGGDPRADAVLVAWTLPLRDAVDSLVAALDPEVVLLGGGLGREAAQALARLPERSAWYRCPVRPARLGDDAGIVGAALAAGEARPGAKRVVLVNGVPASGKSTIARALSQATGWPVFALDTVKNPFLAEIAQARTVSLDRPFNRVLGRASYAAIFALLREAPAGTTAIVDAWFGFQPREALDAHLAAAGIAETAEVWCRADPATIGARYAARLADRLPGHPGADYVPELVALAGRAEPLDRAAALEVDTRAPADPGALFAALARAWRPAPDAGRQAAVA